MMARQYDNDTVLHYVSTLVGMLWEHSVMLYLMRSSPGRKHIPHFNSKKCQSSHLRTPRAGWWDNACMCVHVYVFVCECVYLSLIDRAKQGADDRAFINLVWMSQKWNVLKCIGLTVYARVLFNRQPWEINIAHFSKKKKKISTYYCDVSQIILIVSILVSIVCDREMECGGCKQTRFLKHIIASVVHRDNPLWFILFKKSICIWQVVILQIQLSSLGLWQSLRSTSARYLITAQKMCEVVVTSVTWQVI